MPRICCGIKRQLVLVNGMAGRRDDLHGSGAQSRGLGSADYDCGRIAPFHFFRNDVTICTVAAGAQTVLNIGLRDVVATVEVAKRDIVVHRGYSWVPALLTDINVFLG